MNDETILSLVDAAFDFFCQRRVEELVDVERVMAAIDAVSGDAGERRLAALVHRLVVPSRLRLLERARGSAERLSAFLPDAAREQLMTLLGHPAPIPRAMVDELVASAQVREAVRAMLQETISSFLQKGFSSAPGGTSLRGLIGLGARAAGAAGRGIFGGLGEELQRQLEERARDFVDGAVGMVLTGIADRLASRETARLLGQRRRDLFGRLLSLTEAQAARQADYVPWEVLEALAPSIVAHNLRRAEVRAAIRAEVEAALAVLSTRTVGELLDVSGLRVSIHDALHAHALPLARAFLASPEFNRWLTRNP